jgi:endogenous inhibitor of DNA gyrase (YacG/DUF329 family)
MKWKCSQCGLELNVHTTRVFCRCGNVTKVELPDNERPGNKTYISESNLRIRTPDWEITHRYQICSQCSEFYEDKHKRCKRIDLGCWSSLNNLIRSTKEKCPQGKWTEYSIPWHSTQDLTRLSKTLIHNIPLDIDAIIGVARSGMLPATIIATALHKPLYAISRNKIIRLNSGDRSRDLKHTTGRFALIEDSLGSGSQIRRLNLLLPTGTFKAAVFVTPHTVHLVDQHVVIQNNLHLFEWNFFNGPQISLCALDLDGVICEDGPAEIYEVDALEEKFFPTTIPKFLPRHTMFKTRAIVTARLEKFREITVAWLAKHGVTYQELIMWSSSQSRTLESVSSWKRNVCRELDVSFYIESDKLITQELRKRHLRVLNIEEGYLR